MSLRNTNTFAKCLMLVEALTDIEKTYLSGYLARSYWDFTHQVPNCGISLIEISFEILEYAAENYEVDDFIISDEMKSYNQVEAKALELTRLIYSGEIYRKEDN